MKIHKNKVTLVILSVVILASIIFSYSKIKEYSATKDAFLFSKDNILAIWRVKKGEDFHDYDYKLTSSEIDHLSSILRNSKLNKATTNDSPSNSLGSMSILLDGKKEEIKEGSISFHYKRAIYLTTIDEDRVYVFLEINKLRKDDDNTNMEGVVQKSYIIDSKELVKFIDDNT